MKRTNPMIVVPLLSLLQLLLLQDVVLSFPLLLRSASMFASREVTSSSRRTGTAACNRRGTFRRPSSPSSSSSTTTTTTTTRLFNRKTNNYSPEDVVELQYSEFLPPSSAAESSHPPVIFLHGLLGNKRNFASLASSLSTQLRNSRPIYTLDLRNHGENTHDWRGSMSYSEMARDVLAFMDKLNETNGGSDGGSGGGMHEKAVLVGHSMGGKVAQSLALMHPERVAGLVVLDIAPVRYHSSSDDGDGDGDNENRKGTTKKGGGGDGSGWKAVEEIVRSVASIDLKGGGYATKRDVDAALRRGMLEDPALRAFVLTNLEQSRTAADDEDEAAPPLRWKIHWDGIVDELDSIAGFDVHDRVVDDSVEGVESIMRRPDMRYEGDVFFIHGGASRFVRHSYISTIASFFPNHMLTTIRGVGHWVHAEAPDDTIALLKRYLDR